MSDKHRDINLSLAIGFGFFMVLFLIILIIYSAVPLLCFAPSAIANSVAPLQTSQPAQNIRAMNMRAMNSERQPNDPAQDVQNILTKVKDDITNNISKFQQSFQTYTFKK